MIEIKDDRKDDQRVNLLLQSKKKYLSVVVM